RTAAALRYRQEPDRRHARSAQLVDGRRTLCCRARRTRQGRRRSRRGARLMPMMGDLLAAARDNAGGFEKWLECADRDAAGRLRNAASANNVTPSAFVRKSVAEFSRFAA